MVDMQCIPWRDGPSSVLARRLKIRVAARQALEQYRALVNWSGEVLAPAAGRAIRWRSVTWYSSIVDMARLEPDVPRPPEDDISGQG